jgi:hypothetical protein
MAEEKYVKSFYFWFRISVIKTTTFVEASTFIIVKNMLSLDKTLEPTFQQQTIIRNAPEFPLHSPGMLSTQRMSLNVFMRRV